MLSDSIEELYDSIKSFHDSEDFKSVIPDLDVTNLVPKLREYQIDAVKWMLYKEYQLDSENLPQDYNGLNIVYPKGGILADEMGLGKTVEMICLILNNPCNSPLVCTSGENVCFLDIDESESSCGTIKSVAVAGSFSESRKSIKNKNNFDINDDKKKTTLTQNQNNDADVEMEEEENRSGNKKKRKKQKQKGECYKHLKKMYDLALQEVSVKRRVDVRSYSDDSLQCSCSVYVDSEEIECLRCHSTQHKTCVGLESFSVPQYYCPKCIIKIQPLKSRATFIVSPDSIVHQWMDELKRHVKSDKLKVYYYTGIKGRKYIQPAELADHDIVITTYSVLSSDLNFCVQESTRTLRYEKKFHSFPPPVKAIDWWRICLDEAQMVEGLTSKPGTMTKELMATHRWAISGTPIQKSISDLYGLMHFLLMDPFMDLRIWNQLTDDKETFCYIFSHLLWRSRKSHVYSMLGIPDQTVLSHWLKFSPVEGHFYERTHANCTAQFNSKLIRLDDLSITLSRLEKAFVTKIMAPLLKLRQACTHPQAVRGKFLKYKRTMTMEELLTDMVGHARQDVDVCVRTILAALNGQAGLKVLLGEINEAIHLYRQVLQLPSQYPKDVIKVDKLQRLHTLHNLADVIKEFGVTAPTLHDESLALDAEDLATNYIEKYNNLIQSCKERATKSNKLVDKLKLGKSLGFSSWWEDVIRECIDPRELVHRVRTNVLDQQTKFPLKGSYSNKINNIHSLYGELALWLAETDSARWEVIKVLNKLYEADPISMSHQAILCHLRNSQDKTKRNKCTLCIFETSLLAYESRIFAITKEEQECRRKNKHARSDNEDELEEDNEQRKEIGELKDTTLLKKTKKEGNWKPSQMERIIQVILTYAKNKKFNQVIIADGQKHLALLEGVRKEFLSLRTLWRHISDRVAAYDEMSMAKMRFRLPLPEEIIAIQKRKLKEPHIIQQHEILDHIERLANERVVGERDLSRNIGILMYLQNLQKNPNTERDPCPVCQEPLSDKWSVLQCGHCFCFECIPNMFGHTCAMHVDCAVCRRKTHRSGIAYVDCTARQQQDRDFSIRGSHSTKVEAVVIEAMRIIKNEASDKILVFSTWEKVLDVIGEAFELNDISFRRLLPNKKKSNQSLADFKNSEVTALLMPLKLGSKGLNLIEATHVFFVEPILNPGEELQAVGRVHRIGQTKKTYVHRFIIHNTVEEKMSTALKASKSEDWSNERVTIRQLFDLFHRQIGSSTEQEITTHSPT